MAEAEEQPKSRVRLRDVVIAGMTAAAVLVANAATTFVLDTGRAGLDAQAREQIQEVIDDALVTPDGRTYGAALQGIEIEMAGMRGELTGIKTALDIITQ